MMGVGTPLQSHRPFERLKGVNATCLGPADELGHIDPAVGDLAVVDPGLRLSHLEPEPALGHPRLFTQGTQESRK